MTNEVLAEITSLRDFRKKYPLKPYTQIGNTRLETISYPWEEDGKVWIMVIEKDNPETLQQVEYAKLILLE